MKVLKKGTGQKGWSKKFKCTGEGNNDGGCGAELLVEEADLFTQRSGHHDGSSTDYVSFKCCECGVITDIWQDYDGVCPVNRRSLPTKREYLAKL